MVGSTRNPASYEGKQNRLKKGEIKMRLPRAIEEQKIQERNDQILREAAALQNASVSQYRELWAKLIPLEQREENEPQENWSLPRYFEELRKRFIGTCCRENILRIIRDENKEFIEELLWNDFSGSDFGWKFSNKIMEDLPKAKRMAAQILRTEFEEYQFYYEMRQPKTL